MNTRKRFMAYPAYKDSGVEWLGEIPAAWSVRRLKLVAAEPIKNGIGEAGSYDTPEWPRYVRITDIAGPRELREDTFKSLPPELAIEAPFKVGDLLLAAVGATFGKSYLHARDCGPVCFAGYLVRFSPGRKVESSYAAYWTESTAYWGLVQSRVVQATIQNFSAAKYKELSLPLPSVPEQRAISAFLDRETARIDALVAKKERLIELLQEERTTLITRAVTKGLNPNSPLKDSGLDWLGEIPAGWEVKRLRFVSESNPVASEVRGLPGETEVSFIPMEAVGERGGLSLEVTKQLADVKAGYTYFRNGDIVIAKITPCFENGKGALAAGLTNGIAFGTTELHVLRVGERADRRFMFYVTLSDAFRRLGRADMYGAGGQKRVPESFVRNFSQPLPSMDEQRTIAAFLDRETARIDALVAKIRHAMERLKELRTALISAAVTGKIDVREGVA